MIKSGLKIYKNNIWEVFALIGFVSIGLLIGFFVVSPLLSSVLTNSIGSVESLVTKHVQSFNSEKFSAEFIKQLRELDWVNPVRTIKSLIENNGLFQIITASLESSGVDPQIVTIIANGIQDVCQIAIIDAVKILLFLATIVGITTFIGYLGTRIIIQARSTSNKNIIKFIVSFIVTIVVLLIVFILIVISLMTIEGPMTYITLIGIFLLMLLLCLLSSILIYKPKENKFTELFNIKSIVSLLLSSLICVTISSTIIIVLFVFSDFVALYIALPLLIVTNIVIENIAIKYVTSFKSKKLKS